MNWWTFGFVLTEASSLLLVKHLLSLKIHPYYLASTSSLISSVILFFYFLPNKAFKKQFKKFKNIKLIFPTGLMIGLGNLIAFIALRLTTATNYTLIAKTSVLITPILAYFIIKEKVNKKLWPLIAVVLAGVWLLTGNLKLVLNFSGDSLALLAAITISLDFIFQKKALNKLNPEVVAFWRRLVSGILVGLMWVLTPNLGRTSLIDLKLICIVSLLFVFMSIFLSKAIKSQPVTDFNLVINLGPIFLLIGAYFFLGERLNIIQLIGSGLILSSIVGYNLVKKYDTRSNPR